jgi:hypothetical protein
LTLRDGHHEEEFAHAAGAPFIFGGISLVATGSAHAASIFGSSAFNSAPTTNNNETT